MANLTGQLEQLEAAQLVRRLPDEELAYIFKHILTQETAYESVLIKKRREIHRLVAAAYEQIEVERLDEFAALLAQHYGQAGDDAKTLEYAARAGDRAARLYANAESISHYTQALELAKRLQGNRAQLSRLYVARGRAFELNSDYEHALANYDEMAAFALARKDRSLELSALMASATIRSTPTAKFDPVLAQALSERTLALARELKDRQAEAKILWNLMLLYHWTGRAVESVQVGERAIALARKFDLREQLAYTLNDIGKPYGATGQLERARAASIEARDLWRELDNKPMLIDNLIGSVLEQYFAGDYDEALTLSANAYRLSQSIGNLWGQSYSLMNVGNIYLERGQVQQALAAMEECLRLGEQAGFRVAVLSQRGLMSLTYARMGDPSRGLELMRPLVAMGQSLYAASAIVHAVLALVYLMNGELDPAEAAVQECYRLIGQGADPTTMLLSRLAAGELALAQQDNDRALGIAEELLGMLRGWGARPYLTDGLLIKGRAQVAQGKLDEAYTTLMQARAEAEALGSRRTLWQIAATLAELERQRGNYPAAEAMRGQALQIIDYIAAHTPADLRVSFLNMPLVRRVLNAGV